MAWSNNTVGKAVQAADQALIASTPYSPLNTHS